MDEFMAFSERVEKTATSYLTAVGFLFVAVASWNATEPGRAVYGNDPIFLYGLLPQFVGTVFSCLLSAVLMARGFLLLYDALARLSFLVNSRRGRILVQFVSHGLAIAVSLAIPYSAYVAAIQLLE
jgi:hypothetical protein